MSFSSHAPPSSSASAPGAADVVDARPLRRLSLFRLDDAVRDARRGAKAQTWLSRKNAPLAALARYRAEHPDVQFEVDEDGTRLRVSITLRCGAPVQ